MTQDDIAQKLSGLKTAKSALLLEAELLKSMGLIHYARPLYFRVAEHEIQLAEAFASLGRDRDAQVSYLSAAHCLIEAHKFATAYRVLQSVLERFIDDQEARQLIKMCEGKADEPFTADMPEIRALVNLLLRKKLIEESEWEAELKAVSQL
jgi:hypothetical protein